MCFGCSKEPSHWDGSFEYPHNMFWMRNNDNNFPICTLIWRPDFWYWDFEADFLAWKFWIRHIIIIIISDFFSDDEHTIVLVWNYLFFESIFEFQSQDFGNFIFHLWIHLKTLFLCLIYIIVVASVWYGHTSLDSIHLQQIYILRINEKLPVSKFRYFRKYIIQLFGYCYLHVSGQPQADLERYNSNTSPGTMVPVMHMHLMLFAVFKNLYHHFQKQCQNMP